MTEGVEPRVLFDEEKAKLLAEVKKFEAETAAALSVVAFNEAQAEYNLAQARKTIAEATGTEFVSRAAQINLLREEQKYKDELTANKFHKRYVFDKGVDSSSVKACIGELTTWSRNDPGCPMELIINSPGGDVVEGFALIDFLGELKAQGHSITTVALGMAASMGGVLLQAGDKRVMGSNAVLLIHEAQFGAIGSYGEVQDRVKLVEIFHERILDLFASRSKVTKAFIKRNWNRKDWWLSSTDALKHGFVDEVR